MSFLKNFKKGFRTAKKIQKNMSKLAKSFENGSKSVDTNRANKKQKFNNVTLSQVDKLSGIDFEYFCADLFSNMGYNAQTTKASGDYGADLVLTKNGTKIVVQAKRYSKNISVGAVQEIVSAKAMYRSSEAWVITNQYFTKNAITLAQANGVKLIDRDMLAELIKTYK